MKNAYAIHFHRFLLIINSKNLLILLKFNLIYWIVILIGLNRGKDLLRFSADYL